MKLIIAHALKILLSGAACVLFASGCETPQRIPVDSISSVSTHTASASLPMPEETVTPLPELLPTNFSNPQDLPTVDETLPQVLDPLNTATQISLPCNLAAAGNPLDVSIPDDTRLAPGENFTKIWRLTNGGACTWSTGYSIVWFSGDDFGTHLEEPVFSRVNPGESVEFSVDMTAPSTPGVYSGYWKLQSDSGQLFGIGPSGDSPFWVRVQVVAVETATPTITPTIEPTSIVLVSGSVSILPGQSVDLDTGEIDDLEQSDGLLEQVSPDRVQWASVNNGRYGVFGLSLPGELECKLATLSDQPLQFDAIEVGTYICYRTGEGLPGMLQINTMSVGGGPLQINFTTWAIP